MRPIDVAMSGLDASSDARKIKVIEGIPIGPLCRFWVLGFGPRSGPGFGFWAAPRPGFWVLGWAAREGEKN